MQATRPLLVLLFALSSALGPPGCQVKTDLGRPKLDPQLVEAQGLAAAGEPLRAAALVRDLAERRTGIERHRLLLRAADLYLDGNALESAHRLLVPLDSVSFAPSDALHLRLLHADLLLREERADEALLRLAQAPEPEAPIGLQRRYHRLRGEAYRRTGQPLRQARSLQALDLLQPDPSERLLIQQDLLHALGQVDRQTLRVEQPAPPDAFGGWMQLALELDRYQGYPRNLEARLAEWHADFPSHPVLPELLESLLSGTEVAVAAGRHIAVLLPESGRYAKAAAAIRDGFLAAWYQDPGEGPRLEFYDSSDPAQLWPTYSQAVEKGAQLVVGPLDKAAVAQLVRAGELPVPVLTLNQVDSADLPPPNLFQFSLSPEDEARQAAERAWLDGLRRPLMLVPADDWGERLAQAFEQRWAALGGQVVDQGRYDPNEVDHSEVIGRLMGYREREVEGKRKPQPERRQDIDFIFIVARAEQAQQIRPQLLYFLAGELPIYATSHAWTGRLNARQVRDMVGIRVPEIPWLVGEDPGDPLSQARMRRLFPASDGAYAALYAMGIDAYRLVPHLGRLQSSPDQALPGKTGILSLNERNHVQRRMLWLRIDKVPEVLGYSPPMPTADAPATGLSTSVLLPAVVLTPPPAR